MDMNIDIDTDMDGPDRQTDSSSLDCSTQTGKTQERTQERREAMDKPPFHSRIRKGIHIGGVSYEKMRKKRRARMDGRWRIIYRCAGYK